MYNAGYNLTTDNIPNPYTVDIDDNTVIGIDFQAYDFKKPSQRLVNHTNTFSIPATNKNLAFFGFPDNVNRYLEGSLPDRSIYNIIEATYQLNNEFIFYKAIIRIDSIENNRISISIVDSKSNNQGINLLKSIDWDTSNSNSLVQIFFQFVNYLNSNTLPVSLGTAFDGTWTQFYQAYLDNSSYFRVGAYVTNLFQVNTDTVREDYGTNTFYIATETQGVNNGYCGRFSFNVSIFFYALNWYYETYGTSEIKFNLNESLLGSIFQSGNDHFSNSYIFTPSLLVYTNGSNKWWFTFQSNLDTSSIRYAGNESLRDKSKKTAFDFLITVCQQFNLIIKQKTDVITNITSIELYNFNKINYYQNTNIVDWSKNFKGIKSFKPSLDNFYRDSWITYKHLPEQYNFRAAGYPVYSNNNNLPVEGTILEIDAYLPYSYTLNANYEDIPWLNDEKSFEEFIFLNCSGDKTPVNWYMWHSGSSYFTKPYIMTVQKAATDMYGIYNEIFNLPRIFTIEKWITLDEISKLDFFNQYYFEQLGASFYINKISGYNPMKSFDATTLELIEVSKKIPFGPIIPNVWVDGNNEIYTDGTTDYYIY
jgi:hypothetical protein